MRSDRSRRRFEEGSRLVEEAHQGLAEIQQLLIGSPVSLSAEENEEAASRLLASLKASGSELPETLCGGRLAVDPVQRLIRIDGHPIGITEMEYRVLELLAAGYSNNAIVEKLFVSDSTVRTHLRNIFMKLKARNRTHAVAIARQLGIVT